LLFLSTISTSLPLPGGCTLLTGASLSLPVGLGPEGSFQLPATLPFESPSLHLYLQLLCADPGSANSLFTATNGLDLSIR
jgi:hypothetical protein